MSTRPVSVFLDSLVHATAAGEAFAALRHMAFILAGFAAGTLAIAAILVSLALGGPRPLAEVALLGLLAGEVAVAGYLSRTGNIDIAQIASAVLLTAVIVGLAAMTGGARSPALVWMVFVPLDASLAGSRRTLLAALAVAATGLAGLLAASNLLGNEAETLPRDFAAFPTLIAALVGAALALRMGWMIAGMTRLAARNERVPALAPPLVPPVTGAAIETTAPAMPAHSAEIATFVAKDRLRPEPLPRPAAEHVEMKELLRA